MKQSINQSMRRSINVSPYHSIYLPIYRRIYQSIILSDRPSTNLSIYEFANLLGCRPFDLSIYQFTRLSSYRSVYRPINLSTYQSSDISIYQFTYLPININIPTNLAIYQPINLPPWLGRIGRVGCVDWQLWLRLTDWLAWSALLVGVGLLEVTFMAGPPLTMALTLDRLDLLARAM